MRSGIGAILRERRVARGETLDQLADRIRLPVAYLEAMEQDGWEELPPGPYREAYLRAYAAALEVELEPPPEPPPEPQTRLPLWAVRWITLTAIALMAVLIGWQAQGWIESYQARKARPVPPVVEPPDQHVRILLLGMGRLRVEVDGQLRHDRVFPEGEVIEVVGRDEVRVQVAPGGKLTVRHNERFIEPQGSIRYTRELVFFDDTAAGS